MVAGIHGAQAQQYTPEVLSFPAGTQEIRKAAPKGFCFLDRHLRAHRAAWEYAQSQTGGDPLVAVVATCEGLGDGETFWLTALFVLSAEADLSRDEVLLNAESIMAVADGPLHLDPERAVSESMRRFKTTVELDIASVRIDDVFVDIGTDQNRKTLYMLGMTPLRDMILRSFTLHPITSESEIGGSLWLHAELLGSVRRNTPGWSLDDAK